MFLKRLDVVGFKSFAEKISIDFVPGVTAVVGPNGSGKSNVTDAVRWVLGEQSAKSLRGAKMEDIIFSGSDTRKALNFAEVSLTLDNETNSLPIDFHEVSVTRRVYRSGESEFFINNQGCRLKDIIDLFMDSGLGREAFSIISQGKVEEILSSKAEERRVIFEEAAGVLKYKTRKRKAESKLTETQDNLNRVHDILHELEGQVEPLKIQSSLAKEFLAKKDELEQIEVALTVYEIEELYEKWEKLSQELEKHNEMEQQMAGQLQDREAHLKKLRDSLATLETSINGLQEILLNASEELEKLEGRKEVLKERKKNAAQNKSQLEKAIVEGEAAVERLSLQKERETEILHALNLEVKGISETLHEKQKSLGLFNSDIEAVIEAKKSDYIEWLNKQASAKNEKQYLLQQLAQQEHKNAKLDMENEKFLTERMDITAKKMEYSQLMDNMTKQLEEHVTYFRNQQNKLNAAKDTYQKQETTLYKAYQFLQQAKSRKELLEEMEDDYAGFFQGVKEVLKAKETLRGIEGAVAELIKVPKEYETAIETALGGAMQHVVVEREEHAREAISFLKKNRYGRATFLPLSVIKAREISANQLSMLKSHSAFVGTGSSLIQYDDRHAAIAENLLGTVIITTDLKGANDLAKMMQHRFRFVTLEGDIVNPGGSMTGGALKQKTTSLLSRKTELEELQQKLAAMEVKTNQLEKQVKQLKVDVGVQEQTLEQTRKTGERLRLQEQTLKGELREVELQERNVNERLHLYDLDKNSYLEEQQQKTARLEELEELLESCKSEIEGLDRLISEMTEQKQSQQSSKESLAEETNELKVMLASKRGQLQNQKEKMERIESDLSKESSRLAENKDDLGLLTNEMTDSSSGEESLEDMAQQKLLDKNGAIEGITIKKQEKNELLMEVETLELSLKEENRLYRGIVEVIKDEEVKLTRLDVELENRLDHLREEYTLSFEGAKERYPLMMPADEAQKRVKLIKLAIEELGTVNLGAIDEYARVAERYEFLLSQKEDLQQAKDTLFQVIDEMDDEMKRRFADTFYSIRKEFEQVFKALFGGGRAELKLTNPDDLLNTGVDIIAQPPGKKLQNLSLLSGGERALTAIALLFSILKVRPVPFCILDEVEAALDEANVVRFSQFLRKFSRETQFIVITHRKGTMEEADVLYGITMQESGVSKLVSVRMEESENFMEV
ncbi:chromosome segregation protein SMC [Peribacillus simplex]|uniref:chromosome segregation protein SMC n=1 Tax=Bacillaceae TaxID=186817 RepID=UPI000660550F|nr:MULTISPECIES: chromosome segregation protein SMC [Bacillaceae]MCP1093017.1 chromosome segregation protein SMC [Bacillaceae bacterium OS4b]MBD8587360.1 chromosome segregation protein SMC [Peribacillus simplex]MCF7621724.1 chromosome segregation protein SMC [Peribacillus frigoritolerans]MCT1387344.1 chromosome segregation protein SMC [Peribacillus frigoritolerans]MEA3572813.1 chromosome segregation protein SMC [Peribacillus frigoritolerans]